MLKSILTAVFTALAVAMFAQTGELKVTVLDKETNETIPFANVALDSAGKQIKAGQTNLDGEYVFKNISAFKEYSIRASFVGYKPISKSHIVIVESTTNYIQVFLTSSGVSLECITIVEYAKPLIEPNTSTKNTVTRDEYTAMPSKNINTVVSKTEGIYQTDEGNRLNIRGGRSEPTVYYVDGVKVMGGILASYGDVNTEQYNYFVENNYMNAKHDPLSTFSIDVDKASYSNIRRFINSGQLPPTDAVRIEELINYFSYNYEQPTNGEPFSVNMEATICPWNTKHQIVRIGLKGMEMKMDSIPASNLVFLIDVSGSMESEDKLPLVKKTLEMLTYNLRQKDNVAIVVYAGSSGLVLKSTPGDRTDLITNAIDHLQAGGSTAGGEGIKLAYKIAKESFITGGNNRVILATDGDFNVGVSGDGELVELIEKEREKDIFLTVLGYGTGNYKDSKMELLADKGNGNYFYIDNMREAKKVAMYELTGTIFSIAKDVKIQVEFNPKYVKSYRLVGYENRKMDNQDFNDDKKDAGELGAGHTVTALYEIVPASNTEIAPSIDSLKYQSASANNTLNEILTLKIRYKKPDEKNSRLISKVLTADIKTEDVVSNDMKFALAVAEFGMLLRESKYKGESSYEHVIKLAESARSNDQFGYRKEFVELAEAVEKIKK